MGLDLCHARCQTQLSDHLLSIFYSSLETGTILSILKKSLVLPIFKKGYHYYRPVSLTTITVKTMEHMLMKFIYNYVEFNNLLNKDQFGF